MVYLIINFVKSRMIIFRYLLSGGIGASVNISLLFFLTDILHIYYLISTSIAFVIAYLVSFYLQKFWTFQEKSRDKILRQMFIYFIVGTLNLIVNGFGMYILVDLISVYYLFAQVIMGGTIAISSFVIYRFLIFKKVKIAI